MRTVKIMVILLFGIVMLSFICNRKAVKPGENRLTIDLKSGDKMLNAQAKVYLNDKFIGMTDENGDLVIRLKKGEYNVRITLDGYENWEETILMVGKGHSQVIYPNMRRR